MAERHGDMATGKNDLTINTLNGESSNNIIIGTDANRQIGELTINNQKPNEEVIEWNEDEEARIELGLVGETWTKRSININAFMTTIKKVWQPIHGLDISSLGENKYVFQFHHWRDKLRVVEGQPWHFDRHAILLRDISDATKPSNMVLHELPMWVRVYNLPFKGRLKRENVEALGKKIGRFIKADVFGSVGIDKSIRPRINVDVRKPLTRKIKVKMRGGEEDFVEVKYEKPPLYCFYCGLMGHGIKDCPECRDEEDPQVNYGGWLKASPWKRMREGMESGSNEGVSSCARNLFITRPKKIPGVEVCSRVNEMVGKLSVCGLESSENLDPTDQGGSGEKRMIEWSGLF